MSLRRALVLASIGGIGLVSNARADSPSIDWLATVVNNANAVAGPGITTAPPLGTFGYDPVHDQLYVAGFSNGDQEMRRIDNVSAGTFSQTVNHMINQTAWFKFTKNNLNNGGGAPTPSALLLNPQAIGATPAYSNAWVIDIGATVTIGSPAVNHPELTRRIYSYNLAADTNADANDEFTSQMTLDQFRIAAGGATGSLTTNIGRQYAWSGNGQNLYFVDTTSGVYGGLWKLPAAGGAPTKLTATVNDNTEPAMTTAAGVDTLYFRGGAATANAGGIDKITYDGTTVGTRSVAIPVATINDFLELTGAATITTFSMCADADGNLYFNDTGSNRPGVYRYDPQGRLSKVLSRAERQAAFGATAQANTLRMQPRTATYGTGPGAFNLTQILYAESTPLNFVAGAYVFKPGDFNRDNVVDQADADLIAVKQTARGTAAALADLKYDMNGNGECSFKDIKIFQTFRGFRNGDANMDLVVDSLDFNALAANFGQPGFQPWVHGDFSGDQFVDSIDFNVLAANFGLAPPPAAARSLGTVVPEPTMIGFLAMLGLSSVRRR